MALSEGWGPLLLRGLHQGGTAGWLLPGLGEPPWSGRRKWDRREGHDHRGRGQMEPVDMALQAAHSLL